MDLVLQVNVVVNMDGAVKVKAIVVRDVNLPLENVIKMLK